MSDKKYYWLKLQRDFFKRHDIRIVEEMPNGKDYILFYLKLLLESINHEGRLRFSEEIPYNAEMLSVITNTNIDIVRTAIKIFCDLGMISIYDDQTIYLNEVQKMIGCETEWAQKKRDYRERLAISNNDETAKIEQNEDNVLSMSDKSKSKSKSKNIKENIQEKSSRFVPPTLSEVKAYCQERNNGVNPEKWFDFYTSKNWMIGKNKMIDWKAAVRTWEHGKENKPAPRQSTGNQFFDLLNQEASS